jgi:hypothetical protein
LAHLLHGRGSVVDEAEGFDPLLKGVGLGKVREGKEEGGGREEGREKGEGERGKGSRTSCSLGSSPSWKGQCSR